MKNYSLLFFILFFCFLNPRVSVAEPGFFFQTLTNSFVDWVFGQLDSYIQDKPDESGETQDEKIPKLYKWFDVGFEDEQKKLIESLKKVNNYNEKYLINALHGKVDNWTLKEVVRGHTAFHLNQFGVY